jgi:proteasome lid subunit RPN8/RPN11
MAANITAFPLGNADSVRIDLADGRKVLIDFGNQGNPDDPADLRCDLAAEIRTDLRKLKRDNLNVVCFTHLDADHCDGASDFFHLRHADKYQGEGRIKIDELWVPSAAITEDGLDDCARVIRQEARYRLKEGKGIRVFSRPDLLKEWASKNNVNLEARSHLIVDAGKLVPGFSKDGPEKAEFFVHCPFAWRTNENELVERNQDSIVFQVTFKEDGVESYALFASDVDYETLSLIVQTSKTHRNEHRLLWDFMKLPHHCSYTALGPDRGTEETKAVPDVKWLFETQGNRGAYIVSTSKPIPAKGSKDDAAKDQGSQSGYAPALTPNVDQAEIDAIRVEVADVHIEFDQARAADTRKVVMIGAGAIGSQTAMILAREGRFSWTVVDDDRLLPHNLARHSLEFRHLCQPKAAALCAQLDGLRPPHANPSAKPILCNVLMPREHSEELNAALENADVIIDASASVAVSRFLSDHPSKARRTSIFFNPAGDAAVALVEPTDRHLTLRDLEARYYRAVLRVPALERHLSATGERFAYTGACRAVTNRIPESRAALLSALSAAALGQMLSQPAAGVGVWSCHPDGSVAATLAGPAEIRHARRLDWTVSIDQELVDEISAIRDKSLPAETGGVLLGVVDAEARSIHIVDVMTAPPDSVEENSGFERGIAGLENDIRKAMIRTMDQVRYVGEWHSHPPRYSIKPSDIDLTQIGWLAQVLSMENRPGIMLITGDAGINLLSGEVFS